MYDKIDKFITKILNSIIITVLIFVTGFTITATFLYNVLDFKYATNKDYEPLYQIQETIINNFDTVYSYTNTDIDITDSNIIVFIYSEDYGCYLKTYFDKTKTLQSTEKVDNTHPICFSIIILIVVSIIGSMLFYLSYILILSLIDKLFHYIT